MAKKQNTPATLSYGIGRNSHLHVVESDSVSRLAPFEVVERKGLGHPDTLCDALACALSRAYALFTMENCDGLILHHQFDKIMLIGGKSEVSFGKLGFFSEPIRLIISGRASTHYKGARLPVKQILEETARNYLASIVMIPDLKRDLIIEHKWTNSAGPGTICESEGPIAQMFTPLDESYVRGYGAHYVSNDTSYCSAYTPMTVLETAVLNVEKSLNSMQIKEKHQWMGTDIKIMATRIGESIYVTMCIPQIARFVPTMEAYRKNLDVSRELIQMLFSNYLNVDHLDLSLNTKDNFKENNVYLTATGSSLSGDIGVTGRGNRINGLITANRPMSLEGASGKNPRYYAGIVYNLAAKHLSQRLFLEFGYANEVIIVSQNGDPLLSPKHIIVLTDGRAGQALLDTVESCVSNIPELTQKYLEGDIDLY
ncbi:MAG: hypothetical protein H6657_32510 [Ardenticatenaceae bacterium]|nr:hypothetical protein [Ardenticatenaceae bacterium]